MHICFWNLCICLVINYPCNMKFYSEVETVALLKKYRSKNYGIIRESIDHASFPTIHTQNVLLSVFTISSCRVFIKFCNFERMKTDFIFSSNVPCPFLVLSV